MLKIRCLRWWMIRVGVLGVQWTCQVVRLCTWPLLRCKFCFTAPITSCSACQESQLWVILPHTTICYCLFPVNPQRPHLKYGAHELKTTSTHLKLRSARPERSTEGIAVTSLRHSCNLTRILERPCQRLVGANLDSMLGLIFKSSSWTQLEFWNQFKSDDGHNARIQNNGWFQPHVVRHTMHFRFTNLNYRPHPSGMVVCNQVPQSLRFARIHWVIPLLRSNYFKPDRLQRICHWVVHVFGLLAFTCTRVRLVIAKMFRVEALNAHVVVAAFLIKDCIVMLCTRILENHTPGPTFTWW